MPTALSIIQDSGEKIGAFAVGETVDDATAQRCLGVLNNMLDSWSTESLTCFALLEQTVVLTVNKITYTLGTGGDIAVRPTKVLAGPGAAYVLTTTGNRYPVDVVEQDVWNRIWSLTNTNSSWPNTLFYDPQMPLGKLNVYPKPNQAGMTLFWDSYLPLTAFSSLTANVSLPPGYTLALVDTLARRLWRYFKPHNVPIPQDIILEAAASKGNIKRINNRENLMVLDRALGGAGRAYNPYSDSVARR